MPDPKDIILDNFRFDFDTWFYNTFPKVSYNAETPKYVKWTVKNETVQHIEPTIDDGSEENLDDDT